MIHPHALPAIPLAYGHHGVERLSCAKRADKLGAIPLLGLPVAFVRGTCSLAVLAASVMAFAIARLPLLTHTAREASLARWRIIALHALLEGEHALHELIPGMAKKHRNFDTYFAWKMSLALVKRAPSTELLAPELQAFSQLCTSHIAKRPADHPLLIASQHGLWSVCFFLIQNGIKMEGRAHQQVVEQTLAMRLPSNATHHTKDLAIENLMDMELRNLEQARVAEAVINPLKIRNLLQILQREIDTADQTHGFSQTKIFLNHAPVEVIISVLQLNTRLLEHFYACKQVDLLPLLFSRCNSAELTCIQKALYLAMEKACQDNDLPIVRMLLGSLPAESNIEGPISCLRIACLAGHVDLVKLLIASGVDLAKSCRGDDHNPSLLHRLCQRPFKKDILILILQAAPSAIALQINSMPDKRSALWTLMEDPMVVSRQEQVDQIAIANCLLKKRAFLSEIHDGVSLLQLACRSNNSALFPSLIGHSRFLFTKDAMSLLLSTCRETRWQETEVQATFKLFYSKHHSRAPKYADGYILRACAHGATEAFIDGLLNVGYTFFTSHKMTVEEQHLMKQLCCLQGHEFYKRHKVNTTRERLKCMLFLSLFSSLEKLWTHFYGVYDPETTVRSTAFTEILRRLAAMPYDAFCLLGNLSLNVANATFFKAPYFQISNTHYCQKKALHLHAHAILLGLLQGPSHCTVCFLGDDFHIMPSCNLEMKNSQDLVDFFVAERLVACYFDNDPLRAIQMKNGIPSIRAGKENISFCTGPLYLLFGYLTEGDPLYAQVAPLLPRDYLEMLSQLFVPHEVVRSLTDGGKMRAADAYRPLLKTFVMCCGDHNEKATIKEASDNEIMGLLEKYAAELQCMLHLRQRAWE